MKQTRFAPSTGLMRIRNVINVLQFLGVFFKLLGGDFVTLGDVLLRRVPVALGACWSESCSREAALRIGAVMGWDDHALGANLESFEMERSAFLHRPSRAYTALQTAAD